MGSIKLHIHPLFWLFGAFYALTGKVFMFIIYTTVALLHELGHSFSAEKLGYRLDRITLMPYGAVIYGEDASLKPSDEIRIALAGPVTNVLIGIFFVAFWWIFPDIYPYTDAAAFASFAIAAINVLPVFPLDGGRVLLAVLSMKMKRAKALLVCKVVSVVFGAGLAALFIASLFFAPNVSLAFFAAFVLFGALSRRKENGYVRMYTAVNANALKRGMLYKKQALSVDADVKKLINVIDGDAVNEIVLFRDGKEVKTLSQSDIAKICQEHGIYEKLSDVI